MPNPPAAVDEAVSSAVQLEIAIFQRRYQFPPPVSVPESLGALSDWGETRSRSALSIPGDLDGWQKLASHFAGRSSRMITQSTGDLIADHDR